MDLVAEEHAGRAVKLTYNHPLGAVNYECAFYREKRYLAEKNLALNDILEADLSGLLVLLMDDEAESRFEWSGVSKVPLFTLLFRVLRLADYVAVVFEFILPLGGFDGENRIEYTFQPLVSPFFDGDVALQELLVALQLNGQKVGYLHYFGNVRVGNTTVFVPWIFRNAALGFFYHL
jgi:hypothetical protein